MRRLLRCLVSAALILTGLVALAPQAVALPQRFQKQTVFSGLTSPTNVEFAADGRVFVAEKGGYIKVFDSLTDTTPTVYADLRTRVHDFWDRGLLGLALHPGFPADPRVYVLYSYDAEPGGAAPLGPGQRRLRRVPLTSRAHRGRLPHHRPPVRHLPHGRRDPADHRLVPAVSEPLGRRPAVRPRRRALRLGR
ncbi:PQQ-dependent sugar dehydrogenase [Nonomuraea thailandensis]